MYCVCRRHLLVVFDVRLWLAVLAGCLFVCRRRPSFLPSFFLNIIPVPSSAFFVRAVRHQLALKAES
jgi:hypothetical protein